jgi:hypothetical protein
LQASSVTAATALDHDLIGATATGVVKERPALSGPAAVVVPLVRRDSTGQKVIALVAYLTDCTGRAYFDAVNDRSHDPLAAFPPAQPGRARSAMLVFSQDPFEPFWR